MISIVTKTMASANDPSKRRRLLWESKKDMETTGRNNGHSTVKSQQKLPPPFTYEGLYSTYGKEWEERQKKISPHVIVSDHSSFCVSTGSWLVACTSLGEVILWRVSDSSSNTNSASSETPLQSPVHQTQPKRIKVSKLPLKSIQVIHGGLNSNGPTILAGGEEGLFSISCPVSEDSAACNKWEAVAPGVHQVLVDETADRVYLLGEKQYASFIQVYNLSNQNWNQSINLGASDASVMALSRADDHDITVDGEKTSDRPSMILLIGTTNSQIVIWKSQADSSSSSGTIEKIRLYDPDSGRSNGRGGVSPTIPVDFAVTSICCSSQDQWWTIAGAYNKHHNKTRNSISTGSSSGSGTAGGLLATIHGPTRTLVSFTETRETIQGIAIISQGDSAAVYTAANEGVVSVWESPFRLERPLRRVWTNPPSGHAITNISLDADSTTTATAAGSRRAIVISGVGGQVDILQGSCRVQTLHI